LAGKRAASCAGVYKIELYQDIEKKKRSLATEPQRAPIALLLNRKCGKARGTVRGAAMQKQGRKLQVSTGERKITG